VFSRFHRISLGTAFEAACTLKRGPQGALLLQEFAAHSGEPAELSVAIDLCRCRRHRPVLNLAQCVELLLPGCTIRKPAHSDRFGFDQQRIRPARAIASDCGSFRKPAVNLAYLGANAFEFLLIGDVVVGYRAQEVGQSVLGCLRYKSVTGAMEQVLALRDLVLRLEAEGERMADGGGERIARLPRRRFMQIVRQACSGSQ